MTQLSKRLYDLEPRTQKFALAVRDFLGNVPKSTVNNEYVKQLARSSGSIGANYIEANEALGKKDFAMRLRICRKETKETIYWLNLIQSSDPDTCKILIKEAGELTAILGSVISKL